MGKEEILKTAATVAGIKSDRQILGLTLQVAARDANGDAKCLTVDNIESSRFERASRRLRNLSGWKWRFF